MDSAGGPPDSEDYVLRSAVRSGLKREFVFALRSQAELPSSLGRTRSGRSAAAPAAFPPRATKKRRKSGGDLPLKTAATVTDVVDCDDEPVTDIVSSANQDPLETLVSVDVCGESAAEATLPRMNSVEAPVIVDGDDEPTADFVPSAIWTPLATLVPVDGCGESAAEAAPPQISPVEAPTVVSPDDVPIADAVSSTNGPVLETLVSIDGCGESALETAPPQMKPVKVPAVVDRDDEPISDAVSLANGAVFENPVLIDSSCESATEIAPPQVKPIKVFVRSPLRGKAGGLLKSPNRWVQALASAADVPIVLDDVAACKSNGISLDNGCSVKNQIVINCDDELNVDHMASKNQLKSSRASQIGDTVQVSIIESPSPALTMNNEEPLQGTPTVMDYQDGGKMENSLPQKPVRRFTRSLLKVPPVEKEGPIAILSSMENGHDSIMDDDKFPGKPNRSGIKSEEEDSGSDVGAGASGESTGSEGTKGGENSVNGSLNSTPKNKMELKMSKKISLTKLPGNVRELLSTGLLEGLPVKYMTSNGKQIELHGVIKGNGILCSCATCDSSIVVSAYVFEQHAGSTKKHPADFIYLQNGNSLHDVVKACCGAPLDMLEAAIQGAIGPVPPKKCFTCQKCKVSFSTSRVGKFAWLCDSCLELKQLLRTPSPLTGVLSSTRCFLCPVSKIVYPSFCWWYVLVTVSTVVQIVLRHSQILNLCWYLVRLVMVCWHMPWLSRTSSTPDMSNNSSKNLLSIKKSSLGRLTRKDLGLHKLVFMSGILPEGTEVGYYVRGKRLLEGYIKDSGIYCRCCNTVVSPSQFEAHAGRAARRKPYNNIYTSNGVSLHELSVSLSKDRKLSANENDDLCSICADGGDLLLCDLCPRAFHTGCVGLPSIPAGDWYCQYCINLHQRERSVACNDNAIAAGRVAGVDPIEQIFKRSIRIVTTSQTDVGGCAFCRSHDFSKSRFDDRTVMICDQCEKEYHVGCLREQMMADLKELPEGEWFCCDDCSRIWNALQEFLLRGTLPLPELNADIIKKKLENKGVNVDADVDIRWRLLSGKTDTADSKLLLSRAVAIFHESFDPIIEATTGRDLIPSMVYGRTVRDQDFGGMFCAVLTVGSSVVSAGILRVLGGEIAELPLVATSREHQGQGYFQSLFSCIERLLGYLNVKHFLLPAADEAESIWTKKFGFTKITSDQLLKFLNGARTTVFEGTSMLHKLVPAILVSSQVEAAVNLRQC
ncbi:PHD [Musa troglodytarum]|uniref:PHD n=1 Tax=Musa troglodytarum TaxID=320322 RepID=A0A9E7KL01_9LILI|nr:PHD [Musa troglodytarum]